MMTRLIRRTWWTAAGAALVVALTLTAPAGPRSVLAQAGPTDTPTVTATPTETSTPTATATCTGGVCTSTPTSTPTVTLTPTPTLTPTVTLTPTNTTVPPTSTAVPPTSTPRVAATAVLPRTGEGAAPGSGSEAWLAALLAGAGLVGLGGGALALKRRR